jgi:hypothetical protein
VNGEPSQRRSRVGHLRGRLWREAAVPESALKSHSRPRDSQDCCLLSASAKLAESAAKCRTVSPLLPLTRIDAISPRHGTAAPPLSCSQFAISRFAARRPRAARKIRRNSVSFSANRERVFATYATVHHSRMRRRRLRPRRLWARRPPRAAGLRRAQQIDELAGACSRVLVFCRPCSWKHVFWHHLTKHVFWHHLTQLLSGLANAPAERRSDRRNRFFCCPPTI